MFESSVSKDMKKEFLKKRIPRYLLKLIIKDLKISVEQDTVVTILNIIKH